MANDLVSFVMRLNRVQGVTTAKAGNGPARKIFHVYGGAGYSFNAIYLQKPRWIDSFILDGNVKK